MWAFSADNWTDDDLKPIIEAGPNPAMIDYMRLISRSIIAKPKDITCDFTDAFGWSMLTMQQLNDLNVSFSEWIANEGLQAMVERAQRYGR